MKSEKRWELWEKSNNFHRFLLFSEDCKKKLEKNRQNCKKSMVISSIVRKIEKII